MDGLNILPIQFCASENCIIFGLYLASYISYFLHKLRKQKQHGKFTSGSLRNSMMSNCFFTCSINVEHISFYLKIQKAYEKYKEKSKKAKPQRLLSISKDVSNIHIYGIYKNLPNYSQEGAI